MVEAMKTRTPGEFREPTDARGGMVLVKFDRETGERLPDDAEGANVVSELLQSGTEPEIYGVVSAISGDDTLFGGLSVESIFGIDGTDLPFDEANSISAAPQTGGTITDTPQKPQPPGAGSIGLGTGGLY